METRTVNDAIVDGFTATVEAQFAQEAGVKGATPMMRRGAHPRHHGVVRASFAVRTDVPPPLRVGLFREPSTYDAYVRFSNSGRHPDDRERDAHGMAIKLLRLPQQNLTEDERHTQDFLLVDSTTFVARSPEDFLEFMFLSRKLATATTAEERAQIGAEISKKFPNAAVLRKIISNPLTVSYFSQVPFALGDMQAVKYQCRPRVLDEAEPTSRPDDPRYLHTVMRQRLAADTPVVFDFMLQPRAADMDIDDPTQAWSEEQSPFVAVATLTIPPQSFDSAEQMAFAEHMVFNPWHALPEHRPLGRINAARAHVYVKMQSQRHDANGIVHREPTGTNDF